MNHDIVLICVRELTLDLGIINFVLRFITPVKILSGRSVSFYMSSPYYDCLGSKLNCVYKNHIQAVFYIYLRGTS